MRLWWRGPSKWGNPFRADVFGLERCLKLYEHSLGGCWTPSLILDLSLTMSSDVYQLHCDFLGRFTKYNIYVPSLEAQHELAGHDLCCWCPLDKPCHADVLLKLANPEDSK